MRLARFVAAIGGVVVGISCGGDGTGPNLNFPALPPPYAAIICYHGNVAAGHTVNGTLTSADCDDVTRYYESYVVKVPSDGPYDVSLTSSQFSTFLVLWRIDSIIGDNVYLTSVDSDDHSGGGNNSLIIASLLAADDYIVKVAGSNHGETGSYSLRVE